MINSDLYRLILILVYIPDFKCIINAQKVRYHALSPNDV